jgi:inactivated superfamily I helicase
MSSPGGISTQMTGHGAGQSIAKKDLELPSIKEVLADLFSSSSSFSLPPRTESVDTEEQEEMFRGLRDIIEKAQEVDEAGNTFDLKELHASLEEADANSRRGRRDAETLQAVSVTLHKLWACKSEYLVQATEIVANGSRDRESVSWVYRSINLLI